jgi:hypothetical protein
VTSCSFIRQGVSWCILVDMCSKLHGVTFLKTWSACPVSCYWLTAVYTMNDWMKWITQNVTNEFKWCFRTQNSWHRVYLPVCLPVCLSACLSVCLPVYLSVCLSAFLTFKKTLNLFPVTFSFVDEIAIYYYGIKIIISHLLDNHKAICIYRFRNMKHLFSW